jgi:pimeloyl-ACP methyl ester carboxylesterase
MSFVPWNSQPLNEWARKHAPGHFVDLDGHSTHYIETGNGSPVILIHGFFYDTYMWHNNIDALAAAFKVYAFDLWGFGYSTRKPMDYGYPLYSRQLLAFMDALDIRRASLIGQSMGGGTIVKFAISHPHRIDKAILVDPAGMPNPLPLMGRIANLPLIGELMYGLQSDFMRKLALRRNFIHDPAYITDSYFENVTRFHKIKGTSEAMLTILRKRFFDTLLDEIHGFGEIDMPTLIVWGREDQSIPVERGKAMHTILNSSRLQIIDHAGHCPHDEQSGLFNQLVVDFLSDVVEAA